MAPWVKPVVQVAAFSYVALDFARAVVLWIFRARALIVRRHARLKSSLPASMQSDGLNIYLTGAAALVAWNWARLPWLWLALGVFLCLLAFIGLIAAWFVQRHPELLPERVSDLSEEEIEREVHRRRFMPLILTGILALWTYSWLDVLRDILEGVR